MTLHFTFYSKARHIAFFVDFWARRSNLRYALRQNDDSCELFIQGSESELAKFSDELAKMSTSVFLKDTSVQLCDEVPDIPAFSTDFKSANITPYALETGKNECGFESDEDFIKAASQALKASQSVSYKGLIISKLENFDCDYIMPTRLNLLPKIFICDEKNMIALSSFEKPVIRLRTSALFRQNHKDAPLFFGVRAPFDINLFKLAQSLEGINFLAIKDSNRPFCANLLERQLCVIKGGEFSPVINSQNKLAALFALVLAEYKMNPQNCGLIYFSKENADFIKVFKGDSQYEMLKINIPSSYEEIYEIISSRSALTNNFKAKFPLKTGKIDRPANFYSLFCIIAEILGFKDEPLDLGADFSGARGVRIDYKMQSKDEFDTISLIASAMSFRLAGADERNISFGLIESLVSFIDSYTDLLKNELDCEDFVLLGSLFSSKPLGELALKHTNAKLSEIYPLELP